MNIVKRKRDLLIWYGDVEREKPDHKELARVTKS